MNNFKLFADLLSEITILYVEDDKSTQSTISEILQQFCKKVKVASDGVEALLVYKQGDIDLIITDIEMPNMSGIEFVQRIRDEDSITPVIMLSAYSNKRYLLSCLNLNIDSYIIKPVSYAKIKDALSKAARTLQQTANIYTKISDELAYDKINGMLIIRDSEKITLNKKCKDLIDLLLLNRNKLVLYSEIEQEVWFKYNDVMTQSALRTVVKKLRAKVDTDFIDNVSGLGYRIDIE